MFSNISVCPSLSGIWGLLNVGTIEILLALFAKCLFSGATLMKLWKVLPRAVKASLVSYWLVSIYDSATVLYAMADYTETILFWTRFLLLSRPLWATGFALESSIESAYIFPTLWEPTRWWWYIFLFIFRFNIWVSWFSIAFVMSLFELILVTDSGGRTVNY